ncbi:MAG: YbhB/YbcL family Raf kinase inhibitor-like protein [Chitinivibrionales bacterium]|nr:YbhB/YbcL family Raf kinase inhibitor-like protein [Chitinivibrionales bacterium]
MISRRIQKARTSLKERTIRNSQHYSPRSALAHSLRARFNSPSHYQPARRHVMKLSSPAYENNATIPQRFTCKDININPPYRIKDIPQNTQSLCIIMHDPDAPSGDFVHWVGYDIPPTENIEEGTRPGVQGQNDFGETGYGGPCPPSGSTHQYVTELYALDTRLNLPQGRSRKDVEEALQSHLLDSAQLTGMFGIS